MGGDCLILRPKSGHLIGEGCLLERGRLFAVFFGPFRCMNSGLPISKIKERY